jgi:hypothetical protein
MVCFCVVSQLNVIILDYMDVYYDQTRAAPSKIMTQSLPSYEEFMKQGAESSVKQKENRPVPPPRRSLLKVSVFKRYAL